MMKMLLIQTMLINQKHLYGRTNSIIIVELYREREEEFSNGFKHSNKIWAEIAAQIKEINSAYNVMDSLFGDKASIKPPAIATNEGLSDPNEEGSLLSTISSLQSKEPPKKRRRIENIMEEFLANIMTKKEERKKDIKKREANKEKRREENKKENKEQMKMQKSLIS
ncbi:PREDICTED: uncharacterized protein LOC105150385 [Acromyrmex echinatior]|uniref:uncharacterized protein LOC105150385 n=1 Tax=Acromyrmex echinatior TaxID=103372 RepID=UPI000580BCD1|nr:PREDICTED: uncharacterized protein LOC105150385 [Acromyrmex echinatior]